MNIKQKTTVQSYIARIEEEKRQRMLAEAREVKRLQREQEHVVIMTICALGMLIIMVAASVAVQL